MTPELEVCVDGPDSLAKAVAGGADRIELCSALALGGLTPSPGLIAAARGCPVPVYAMIRPRAGDFTTSEAELRQMQAEIAHVRKAGLAGVVLGAATSSGTLDMAALRRLSRTADGLGRTLHRVVDDLHDPGDAVGPAIALGFERILTSGGAASAFEGRDVLRHMIDRADGQIGIMAGGGVLADVVPDLAAIGITSFHASCAIDTSTTGARVLDPNRLAALRRAVADLAI